MPESAGTRTLAGLYKPGERISTPGITIYGKSGAGKTTLLGTMPGKGLVIDVPQIEGGTFVLADKADKIDVKPVEQWNEIDDVYWYLAKEPHDYKWVGIDSITAFQVLARRKIIADRTLDEPPHKIALQEYGQIGQLLGELIYKFRTLPITTVWVAQERKFGEDNDTDTPVMLGPDVYPGVLGALMPSMMLVGRLYTEQDPITDEVERRFRIGTHPRMYAKYRSIPNLEVPGTIKNANLAHLLRFLTRGGEPPEAVVENELFAVLE